MGNYVEKMRGWGESSRGGPDRATSLHFTSCLFSISDGNTSSHSLSLAFCPLPPYILFLT